MSEMYEKKALFVEYLSSFYIENLENPLKIKKLKYVLDEHDEYVYVIWENAQKRFSVWGDSHEAIMKDFCKFLENKNMYRWLPPKERIEVE